MESLLDEYHERIHEVGENPCDEERQEYCAEIVEHKECEDDYSADYCSTDEAVEGDFLFEHVFFSRFREPVFIQMVLIRSLENMASHTTSILPGWCDSPIRFCVISLAKITNTFKKSKEIELFFAD